MNELQRSFYKGQKAHVATALRKKYRAPINAIQVASFKLLKGYNAGDTDLDQMISKTRNQIQSLNDELNKNEQDK